MKRSVKGVGVDAGLIMIADRHFLEKLYDNKIIFSNGLSHLIKVKPGKYDVIWKIAKTWNGPIEGNFDIEVTSGEVFVSDPCYLVLDDDWHNFLNNVIDWGHKSPENTAIISSIGGDGVYTVSLDFKKI